MHLTVCFSCVAPGAIVTRSVLVESLGQLERSISQQRNWWYLMALDFLTEFFTFLLLFFYWNDCSFWNTGAAWGEKGNFFWWNVILIIVYKGFVSSRLWNMTWPIAHIVLCNILGWTGWGADSFWWLPILRILQTAVQATEFESKTI